MSASARNKTDNFGPFWIGLLVVESIVLVMLIAGVIFKYASPQSITDAAVSRCMRDPLYDLQYKPDGTTIRLEACLVRPGLFGVRETRDGTTTNSLVNPAELAEIIARWLGEAGLK